VAGWCQASQIKTERETEKDTGEGRGKEGSYQTKLFLESVLSESEGEGRGGKETTANKSHNNIITWTLNNGEDSTSSPSALNKTRAGGGKKVLIRDLGLTQIARGKRENDGSKEKESSRFFKELKGG